MSVSLTQLSLKRLEGVHPHLVKVAKRAAEITSQPFQVTEGTRTLSRQHELVKRGASRTLRSRHIPAPNGLGHAIDVVATIGGRTSWEVPLYHRIADAMKAAAKEMGVEIEWGGEIWPTFFDGPHFQLPWATYPGIKSAGDPLPPQPSEKDLATLVPGSKGAAVKALQATLNALGARLDVDGDYGPRTRDAVLAISQRLTTKPTDVVTTSLAEAFRKAASRMPTAA